MSSSILSILLGSIVFLTACKFGQKNSSEGSGRGRGKSGAVATGDQSNTALYSPTVGDKVKIKVESRNWTAPNPPPAMTASEQEREISGTFTDGAPCAYRAKLVSSGVAVDQNLGCKPISCGETKTECKDVDIEAKDIGEFKAAKGKETTCLTRTPVEGQDEVTKTVTKTWTHPDALYEDDVVGLQTKSCTVVVATGKTVEDPCAESGATIGESNFEIASQSKGSSSQVISKWPGAKIKISGDVSVDSQSSDLPTCSDVEGKLNATISHRQCVGNQIKLVSVSLAGLEYNRSLQELGPYTTNVFADSKSYMTNAAGNCEVTLNDSKDSDLVKGTFKCIKPLTTMPSDGKTVQLNESEFTCEKPGSFKGKALPGGASEDSGAGDGGFGEPYNTTCRVSSSSLPSFNYDLPAYCNVMAESDEATKLGTCTLVKKSNSELSCQVVVPSGNRRYAVVLKKNGVEAYRFVKRNVTVNQAFVNGVVDLEQTYPAPGSSTPPGSWYPTIGKTCLEFCPNVGRVTAASPDGAFCASGETRPQSIVDTLGVGVFYYGCWPNCGLNNANGAANDGIFCYVPGQKKDRDKTDKTVGCYCK